MEGMAVGLLGVPRDQALQWLRGSGHGNVFLRPFWTDQTGLAVARTNFHLLWVRGQLQHGSKIWEATHAEPRVYGLLA